MRCNKKIFFYLGENKVNQQLLQDDNYPSKESTDILEVRAKSASEEIEPLIRNFILDYEIGMT